MTPEETPEETFKAAWEKYKKLHSGDGGGKAFKIKFKASVLYLYKCFWRLSLEMREHYYPIMKKYYVDAMDSSAEISKYSKYTLKELKKIGKLPRTIQEDVYNENIARLIKEVAFEKKVMCGHKTIQIACKRGTFPIATIIKKILKKNSDKKAAKMNKKRKTSLKF